MLRSEEAGNYAQRLNICLMITNKQKNVAAGNSKGHVCLESVSGFTEYQANQKLTNCCLAIEINIILSHFLWEFEKRKKKLNSRSTIDDLEQHGFSQSRVVLPLMSHSSENMQMLLLQNCFQCSNKVVWFHYLRTWQGQIKQPLIFPTHSV